MRIAFALPELHRASALTDDRSWAIRSQRATATGTRHHSKPWKKMLSFEDSLRMLPLMLTE